MNSDPTKVVAARHICEEASKVLSILRRGQPVISHGSLVHNLRELRRRVKSQFLHPNKATVESHNEYIPSGGESPDTVGEDGHGENALVEDVTAEEVAVDEIDGDGMKRRPNYDPSNSNNDNDENDEVVIVDKDRVQDLSTSPTATDVETATFTTNDFSIEEIAQNPNQYHHSQNQQHLSVQVGAFAQPFLDIILDPMAAGPHTLVALRSLHRLLSRHSLLLTNSAASTASLAPNSLSHNHNPIDEFNFHAEMKPLMRGILECRFEQTDAGADEAVEMAIADLLSLIVSLDHHRVMNAEVVMEAFNTVFVTRNTFVHSPALCYHFEQVLDGIIRDLFSNLSVRSTDVGDGKDHCAMAAKLIIEFLVSQLLHTPMTLEDNGNLLMRNGSLEAFAMHNDTRILCFRLIQTCLKIGWGNESDNYSDDETKEGEVNVNGSSAMAGILKTIKDDLCLSLLLVGQGIWAYQDPSSGALPGMISMNVLSEICSTLSTLWSITPLRSMLTTQFETIFTGFYQRALSLLRRLPVPQDSATFHANQIFDAEVEVILESLVDILSLHYDKANKGAFESLFITYDCNMNRPDVAAGILEELSRCCSSTLAIDANSNDSSDASEGGDSKNVVSNPAPPSNGSVTPVRQSSTSLENDVVPQIRDVPAHLRELCAEALTGVIRTLFFGSNNGHLPSEVTPQSPLRLLKERKTLMRRAVNLFNEKSSTGFKFLISHGLMEEPVTPQAIASFLRNGIVLGLDKRAVGEYLGNKGKSPVAGKSPPTWERDWFHKEALLAYCSSFHFKDQSLLDGLRMFLAAFRLPGEAQQIDRILQAFAESCGLQCEESQTGRLKVFSTDPKKASDAAYLLSFSIIMLNTDLHNDNIRQDRKMKMEDFVKNNTDYGRDITDPDKKLPREYLEGIYARIKEEQIRTEGEGADGIMTFERWKDVMRDSGEGQLNSSLSSVQENVSDLMLGIVQQPILSAICGFWGVSMAGETLSQESRQSGMIGVQGARFGMDLSLEMITGLKEFSQVKLFQEFFVSVCYLTGLLGEYKNDAVDRTSSFVESVERQSALVVVMKVASEHGDLIGTKGWSCVFGIIFELRDLKLLGGGTHIKHRSLIIESDPDLLRADTRRDWEMRLVKQCYEATGGTMPGRYNEKKSSGLFASVGRALFGSETSESASAPPSSGLDEMSLSEHEKIHISNHGKEELVMWDDLAPSDEEDEFDSDDEEEHFGGRSVDSLGAQFEKQLVKEDNIKFQPGPPITGLETYEDTRMYQISPRARVRKRLSKLCDFSIILSETRFLDLDGVTALLQALTLLVRGENGKISSDKDISLVLSPASEALAEVMITEIALKNRDRIGALWSSTLKYHYECRLSQESDGSVKSLSVSVIPGIEKCLTGLLRICYHTVHRDGVNNDALKTLTCLSTYCTSFASPLLPSLYFNKHIAEGLWRICRDVDGLILVGEQGWEGILDLLKHCARGGETLISDDDPRLNNLTDDDPALQAFRCMHLILHSVELRDVVPPEIVHSVRALISGGERKKCPKLSLAGLDLLLVLLTRLPLSTEVEVESEADANLWSTNWLNIIEGMAEASDSKFSNTRQHSMTMMRDALIDRHSEDSPIKDLCRVLNGVCMPVISQRISELVQHQIMLKFDQEEILIELELCISTIFKPFMHHLEKLSQDAEEFTAVWMSMLSVLTQLLGKDSTQENERRIPNDRLLKTTKDLATEHLRNAVMTLIAKGKIEADGDMSNNGKDLSSMTWNALSNISYCKHLIPEWKETSQN